MTDDTDQDWYARYRREVEAAHWQRQAATPEGVWCDVFYKMDRGDRVAFTTLEWPMPICGCTGPCANVACPHRLTVT
jgi:hypothetical protein